MATIARVTSTIAIYLLACGVAHAVPVSFARLESGVDWTSAGVGGVSGGSGTIALAGVSGTVHKAYLYWHGLDAPESGGDGVYDNENVTIDGNPVTGTSLGDSTTNCWPDPFGTGSSRAFRADVTAFVSGNGSYAIAGLSAKTGHSGNGASLIVVFDDGDPGNDRDLAFFEGNDSSFALGFPGETDGWSAALDGITYSSGTVAAQLHVADGQAFTETTTTFTAGGPVVSIPDSTSLYDGNTVPTAGTSRASNGELWDIHTFDLTSAFGAPGPYVLSMNAPKPPITPDVDCLGLLVLLVDLKAGSVTTTTSTSTTTSTTLPGCAVAPTFASVNCRLGVMIARLEAAPDLGRLQAGLVNAAKQARAKKEQAENFDAQGKAKQRRNALKKAVKKLGSFLHKLASRSSRKVIPAATRQSFVDEATPILNDLRSL